jgi:hypothetical protein
MVPSKKHWRVEVLWEDSTVWQKGWEKVDEILEERDSVRCLSVGFILADDKRGMVLAASIHGDEAAGISMIPRSAIVSSKRLRTPSSKKAS